MNSDDDDEDLRLAIALSLLEQQQQQEQPPPPPLFLNDVDGLTKTTNPMYSDVTSNTGGEVVSSQLREQQQQQQLEIQPGNTNDGSLVSLKNNNEVDHHREKTIFQKYHYNPPNNDNNNNVVDVVVECAPFHSILDFHGIMWDPNWTTEPDQIRWLSQGIDLQQKQVENKIEQQQQQQTQVQQQDDQQEDQQQQPPPTSDTEMTTTSTTTTNSATTTTSSTSMTSIKSDSNDPFFNIQDCDDNTTAPPQRIISSTTATGVDTTMQKSMYDEKSNNHATVATNNDNENNNNNDNKKTNTILQQIAQSHGPWGLVQEFGGPCGVLAAVQAELLRILLFDDNHNNNDTKNNDANNNNNNNINDDDCIAAVVVVDHPDDLTNAVHASLTLSNNNNNRDRYEEMKHDDPMVLEQDNDQTTTVPNIPYHQETTMSLTSNSSHCVGDRKDKNTIFSDEQIQTALAGAIAVILARAALTPSAINMDITVEDGTNMMEDNNNMNRYNNNSNNDDQNHKTGEDTQHNTILPPTGVVQIIIPNRYLEECVVGDNSSNIGTNDAVPVLPPVSSSLAWDDLQPWPGMEKIITTDPYRLTGYTIRLASSSNISVRKDTEKLQKTQSSLQEDVVPLFESIVVESSNSLEFSDQKCNTINNTSNDENDTSTANKRQKTFTPSCTSQDQEMTTVCDQSASDQSELEIQIHQLANQVQDFLLAPLLSPSSSTTVPLSHQSASQCSPRPLDFFRNHGGVLLLVLSLTSSRGFATVRSEFDDPIGSKLTSNFGHCSQELMNLLLTGQAVSNVFDNTLKPPGLGMICRGIQSKPCIGYLSQLEAMRYCEVGSFYKSPRVPIWVVGSTSHFTVLFGDCLALKESQSDILLARCRRAFKGVEGGEENGFITTQNLGAVLRKLDCETTVPDFNENKVQALGAALEVNGAGIILWDDFWKAISRILTGASFESVILRVDNDVQTVATTTSALLMISGGESVDTNKKLPPPTASSPPPLLLTNSQEPLYQNEPEITLIESDEEYARRLQQEWEQESLTTSTSITTPSSATPFHTVAAAASSSAADLSSRVATAAKTDNAGFDSGGVMAMSMALSDEEFARRLQAEYDSDGLNTPHRSPSLSTNATAGSGGGGSDNRKGNVSTASIPQMIGGTSTTNMTTVVEEGVGDDLDDTLDRIPRDHFKPGAAMNDIVTPQNEFEYEKYGDCFSLYHYNGLRGGTLTPFRVTRLSADEAVGVSICLSRSSGGGGEGGGATGGVETIQVIADLNIAQDLEDIVRTKWPSCVIHWGWSGSGYGGGVVVERNKEEQPQHQNSSSSLNNTNITFQA